MAHLNRKSELYNARDTCVSGRCLVCTLNMNKWYKVTKPNRPTPQLAFTPFTIFNKRFEVSTNFTLELEVGMNNPLMGRSFYQSCICVAAQHKVRHSCTSTLRCNFLPSNTILHFNLSSNWTKKQPHSFINIFLLLLSRCHSVSTTDANKVCDSFSFLHLLGIKTCSISQLSIKFAQFLFLRFAHSC